MGLEAYQRTQKVAASPRDTEYRLFAQVTTALINAKEPNTTLAQLVDALDWNRRLWSALATDCSQEGNGLPKTLRAQIISLSLWVSRHSSEVARGKADMDDLIGINKMIMEGLAMRPEAAPQ
jgi:flagellar biosynthesis activator protein FlaF